MGFGGIFGIPYSVVPGVCVWLFGRMYSVPSVCAWLFGKNHCEVPGMPYAVFGTYLVCGMRHVGTTNTVCGIRYVVFGIRHVCIGYVGVG